MSQPDFAKPNYKTLPDDEGVDRIEIVAVPRYKMSGLSGDEWRTSASIRFYRKGKLHSERSVSTMEAAVMLLGGLWLDRHEGDCSPLWGLDDKTCAQFSCDNEAAVTVRLKDQFSARGEGPLPHDVPWETRRAFCLEHKRRGDCSREDADDNYEVVTC